MASYRYEGKNERCHPLTQFPEGFDIWRTPNHWANGETSIRFMKNIILPYISATTWGTHGYGDRYLTPSRDTLEVKCNPYCWGITSSQYTRSKNCTDVLQLLNLSANKPLKDHLMTKCQTKWLMENSQRTLKET